MPTRRRCLAGMASFAAPSLAVRRATAAPPPPEALLPPVAVPRGIPGVDPPSLLVRPDGVAIDSWSGWLAERERIRREWLRFLGSWTVDPVGNEVRVSSEETVAGMRRRRVAYPTEPGLETEAWLLEPADASRAPAGGRPAAVVFHSTTDRTIDEVAAPEEDAPAAIGTWLCRRGFVVLCPRCHLWPAGPRPRLDLAGSVARLAERHPGARGMRKLLHDACRAVDVLAAVDGVDAGRIVAAGHSLGAKETLYLAAFDDRVKGAVASEGGIAIPFSNWHDPWYLGAEVREPGFALDHAQLLALALPRGLLVLGGESGPGAADGDRSWPTLARAIEVGRLHDERPRIGLVNHRGGHSLPPAGRRALEDWLLAAVDVPVASDGRGDGRRD